MSSDKGQVIKVKQTDKTVQQSNRYINKSLHCDKANSGGFIHTKA